MKYETEAARVAALEAEVAFLLERAMAAGSVSFGAERSIGMSSNYLVAVCFGQPSKRQEPGDRSDLLACERTWVRLPSHRQTPEGLAVLESFRALLAKEAP